MTINECIERLIECREIYGSGDIDVKINVEVAERMARGAYSNWTRAIICGYNADEYCIEIV